MEPAGRRGGQALARRQPLPGCAWLNSLQCWSLGRWSGCTPPSTMRSVSSQWATARTALQVRVGGRGGGAGGWELEVRLAGRQWLWRSGVRSCGRAAGYSGWGMAAGACGGPRLALRAPAAGVITPSLCRAAQPDFLLLMVGCAETPASGDEAPHVMEVLRALDGSGPLFRQDALDLMCGWGFWAD